MFKNILALAILGLVGATVPAGAQQIPLAVTSTDKSGTIGNTNTFQVVFTFGGSFVRRNGCLIQNNGANPMYVYVHQGAGGTAAKNNSFVLIPPATGVQGGSFSCATGAGGVIQDEIDITGTSSDIFTASVQ